MFWYSVRTCWELIDFNDGAAGIMVTAEHGNCRNSERHNWNYSF